MDTVIQNTEITHQNTLVNFMNWAKKNGAIFPDITFIPTGGINNTNCNSYIELSNVIGVGSTNF